MKELNNKEFKKVILEIYECLKHDSITPKFQKIIDDYKKEIKQ